MGLGVQSPSRNNTGMHFDAPGKQDGNTLRDCKECRTENSSSQGQNLAVTAFFVPWDRQVKVLSERTLVRVLVHLGSRKKPT